jgi:hypothetical protein
VKRARPQRGFVRLAGYCAVGLIACVLAVAMASSCVRVVERNIALASELHRVEGDVRMLQSRRIAQEREITRLSDPSGAVPEIHEKLRLVRDDEAIIYLKKADGP